MVVDQHGRYDEAIHVLKNWISKFGSRKLEIIIMTDNIADIHLKTGQPLSAMEILIDNSDTYQLAKFYLKNDKKHETINVIKRNFKTYKMAHHHLKNNNPEKASKALKDTLHQGICFQRLQHLCGGKKDTMMQLSL